jgi:hypothetical protein
MLAAYEIDERDVIADPERTWRLLSVICESGTGRHLALAFNEIVN